MTPRVRQLRTVLSAGDLDMARAYYRDVLGLAEVDAVDGPDGAEVVVLDAGRATLELATSALTLVQELSTAPRDDGAAGLAGLIGTDAASLGEEGLLRRTVECATAHGAAGQLPFAAVVVRDGRVVGAGVNTAIADGDPTAHGEVTAIRDAARRTGSADLSGAAVLSSCEPCAICRLVAHAAGVGEIVFAAAKELVPSSIDATPEATARLVDAVTRELPHIARLGETGLSTAQLAAPFDAYRRAVTA